MRLLLSAVFIVLWVALVAGKLCEQKVKQGGKVSRVYIYPDCDDTSTYIKQRYQPNHIAEYFYVNSTLLYRKVADKTDKWIVNTFDYTNRKVIRTVDTVDGDLKDAVYSYNDSQQIGVMYHPDGAYKYCATSYNRSFECKHSGSVTDGIIFTQGYNSKSVGNILVLCDTVEVEDVATGNIVLKVLHKERKTGFWYTYDSLGYKRDSIFYNKD